MIPLRDAPRWSTRRATIFVAAACAVLYLAALGALVVDTPVLDEAGVRHYVDEVKARRATPIEPLRAPGAPDVSRLVMQRDPFAPL